MKNLQHQSPQEVDEAFKATFKAFSPFDWELEKTADFKPRKNKLHYKGMRRLVEFQVLYFLRTSIPEAVCLQTLTDIKKIIILANCFNVDLTQARFKNAAIKALKALLAASRDENAGQDPYDLEEDQWEHHIDKVIMICSQFGISLRDELLPQTKATLLFLVNEESQNPEAAIKLLRYADLPADQLEEITSEFETTVRLKVGHPHDFGFFFQLSHIFRIMDILRIRFKVIDVTYEQWGAFLDEMAYRNAGYLRLEFARRF